MYSMVDIYVKLYIEYKLMISWTEGGINVKVRSTQVALLYSDDRRRYQIYQGQKMNSSIELLLTRRVSPKSKAFQVFCSRGKKIFLTSFFLTFF